MSGAKPLRGELAGHYGILFRVEGERVVIVCAGHRDRFYED